MHGMCFNHGSYKNRSVEGPSFHDPRDGPPDVMLPVAPDSLCKISPRYTGKDEHAVFQQDVRLSMCRCQPNLLLLPFDPQD